MLLKTIVIYCASSMIFITSCTQHPGFPHKKNRFRRIYYRLPKPIDPLLQAVKKAQEDRDHTSKDFFGDKAYSTIELYPTIQEMIDNLAIFHQTEKSKTSKQMLFLEALCKEAWLRQCNLSLAHPRQTFLQQLLALNDGREGLYKRTFPVQWKSLMRSLQ